MKTILTLFMILTASVVFFACGSGNDSATAQQTTVQQAAEKTTGEFTWYRDWDTGMAAAKKENKPVLVDFYADWCGYCKKFDKEAFADAGIKDKLAKDWIGIKINGEDKNGRATIDGKKLTHPEVMQQYGIKGFPTILLFDKTGKAVEPYTTYINYVPIEPFGPLLDYFKDELYSKDVDINEYIKANI